MMDLRQLQVLAAVAATGSLAAAARSLHFGQPTIAYHLDRLEAHVSIQLVARSPRGARLTPAGELMNRYGKRILGLVDEAEAATRATHGDKPLSIGTFQSAGALLLAPVIAECRRAGSIRSRIDLLHGSLEEHLSYVRTGRADCAIVYAFDDLTRVVEDLEVRPLLEDPYRVIAHRTHPLANQSKQLRMTDLASQRWITRRRAEEADDIALRVAADAAGFEPQVLLQEDEYSVAAAFLSVEGVMLLPQLTQLDPAVFIELPVSDDLGARKIFFVTRPGDCRGEVRTLWEQLVIRLERSGDATRQETPLGAAGELL